MLSLMMDDRALSRVTQYEVQGPGLSRSMPDLTAHVLNYCER